MKRKLRIFLNIIIIFLPWKIRRKILNSFYKYKISATAKIGFSYVYPQYLEMHDGAKIEHLNIAIHLDKLIIKKNSIISRGNWITGFPTNDKTSFSHDKDRRCELIIGEESAITKNHHIDCTNYIHIGHHTTIAGYNSQFLTHSINIYESRQDSFPIIIGDYCFISTSVIILGGSKIPNYSVLAAGAVCNKPHDKEWTIYAGIPAIPVKQINETAKYFRRKSGFIH